MNKKLVLLGATMLLSAGIASAQKLVTGRVLDANGEPVIGAAVRVVGGKGAVATDVNGNFTLKNVPASAKHLKVTYIGKREQQVSIASNLKVVLQDDEKVLEEAVVVGYGSARKVGTLVGSVTKVDSKDIANKPSTNIADALQGKVAGMQVLTSSSDAGNINASSITVRGVGSIGADSEPLVVIDGTPASTSMLGLMNSNDIESVVTLKDASATSIYGSRAANGVIYITTKKGRTGEKAQVTLSQKVGWSQLAAPIGKNMMSAAELLDFQLQHGIISAKDYATYKSHGVNTDWQGYLFSNAAPQYQTDVSIRGAGNTTRYYLSGSFLDNTGVDEQSHMTRYTLRANLDAKPKDWLNVGVNQNIIYTDRATNGYTSQGTSSAYSYSTQVLSNPRYWDPYHPSVAETHKLYLSGGMYDIHWLQEGQPRHTNDLIYNGNAYVDITPIKGLHLKSQLGLYATNSNSKSSVLTWFPGMNGQAEKAISDSRSAQWTITNTAEYNFQVGENHDITLLAGQEGIKSHSEGFSAGAHGSTDDRLLMLGNMTEATIDDVGESSSDYQFLSFFGRADYNFKNKYFANFTVRNDQSSRFGKTNRSAMFYSGGLMWNMKREYFLRGATWLDNLELRASVGSTGNAAIGNYAHLGLIGNTQYGGVSGWGLSQPSNTELGWEKQIQTNVGFVASFFNRVNLEANFYHRKTKDMLMGVPIPTTTGFSSQAINIGEMSNRGVELTLSYDIIKTRDAFLNLGVNYAYNKNKIDELFYGLQEWEMKSYLLNYVVGKSLNFYMPVYAGVDQTDGKPMWYKVGHNGEPGHTFNPETMTKDESQIENLYQDTGKSRFAPHTGGFNIAAGWKGLTLNANFAFVAGKWLVDNSYFWLTGKSNLEINKGNADRDMLDIWKQPGDLASLPAFQYQSQFDTHILQNASFLRLKDLVLAYELPKKWMEASNFFQSVRFNFITRNLFTITPFKGADPEVDSNISMGNYPATRQFMLGIDVTF